MLKLIYIFSHHLQNIPKYAKLDTYSQLKKRYQFINMQKKLVLNESSTSFTLISQHITLINDKTFESGQKKYQFSNN